VKIESLTFKLHVQWTFLFGANPIEVGGRVRYRKTNLIRFRMTSVNSTSGRIFVGINDDSSVPGISVTNELKAGVQAIVRVCDLPVNIELETFYWQKKYRAAHGQEPFEEFSRAE
jgi:hypothetical protein